MSARPESMQGRGNVVAEPIPTRVSVTAQNHDPAKTATGATFAFGPTDRAKVDAAVAAFVAVLEAPDADLDFDRELEALSAPEAKQERPRRERAEKRQEKESAAERPFSPAPHYRAPARPAECRRSRRTTSSTGASRCSTRRAGRGPRSPSSSATALRRCSPTRTRTSSGTSARSTTRASSPSGYTLPPSESSPDGRGRAGV